MKILVLIGVFSSTDSTKPIAIKIDFAKSEFEASLNKKDNIKTDYKIIDGKALIGNKLINDGEIIEIYGDEYLVDVKINYIELEEYKLFQKIVHNFTLLNNFTIFKWTFYIRSLIYVISFFALFGFKEGLFWTLIMIPVFAFLTFTIVNTFGWTGTWGYILYLSIILLDTIIGAKMGANDENY